MTRGLTEIFLIGHPEADLGNPGKLPVARKVLQYIKYLQTQPGVKTSTPMKSLICCPLITSTHTASCSGSANCASQGSGRSRCLVAALCEYWNKSGIPKISDYAIMKKTLNLWEEWKVLSKNKNKTSSVEINKREKFEKKLDELFDIASPNAIKDLENDRLRSSDARQADINFYLDQKSQRIGFMGGMDTVHRKSVENKMKRIQESELRQDKASSSSLPGIEKVLVSEMEEIEDDIGDDDFVAPVEKKAKKPDKIPLLVPRNITKAVALSSKRFKIRDVANIALIIKKPGGNLDDFVLSTRTCRREGVKAVIEDADKIKETFKNNLKVRDLTLHFDGKAVRELTAGCHLEQERIAVIVSSPTLKSPQVLGVPPARSSKGVDQLAVLTKLIEEWGVKEFIMAIGFDTTSSNTGIHAGAVTLVEQYLGQACMWSACQRHIHELHIKHAAESVFGPTSSPSDKMFKNFRQRWPEIKDKIDYSNLAVFYWKKLAGTVVEKEATETLQYCRAALADHTFPREDYRELVQLILVWLGGVEEVTDFKFQWPGAFHHARFMAKSLYILKLDILSTQINILSEEEKDQVARLAMFVGIYFGVWFLQCGLSSIAPYKTITTFEQMLNFSEIDIQLAFSVMESMRRHTWYITQQWVVVCLADTHCPEEERKAVATALANTPRPDLFVPGKPDLPVEFWPESGVRPSLASFVGQQSWLLPSLLKLTPENMEWLFLDVHQWHLMSGYRRFSEFVMKLLVVNDPAERGVKLIQDFISTSTDEGLRQAKMISASEQRKKISINISKSQLKNV